MPSPSPALPVSGAREPQIPVALPNVQQAQLPSPQSAATGLAKSKSIDWKVTASKVLTVAGSITLGVLTGLAVAGLMTTPVGWVLAGGAVAIGLVGALAHGGTKEFLKTLALGVAGFTAGYGIGAIAGVGTALAAYTAGPISIKNLGLGAQFVTGVLSLIVGLPALMGSVAIAVGHKPSDNVPRPVQQDQAPAKDEIQGLLGNQYASKVTEFATSNRGQEIRDLSLQVAALKKEVISRDHEMEEAFQNALSNLVAIPYLNADAMEGRLEDLVQMVTEYQKIAVKADNLSLSQYATALGRKFCQDLFNESSPTTANVTGRWNAKATLGVFQPLLNQLTQLEDYQARYRAEGRLSAFQSIVSAQMKEMDLQSALDYLQIDMATRDLTTRVGPTFAEFVQRTFAQFEDRQKARDFLRLKPVEQINDPSMQAVIRQSAVSAYPSVEDSFNLATRENQLEARLMAIVKPPPGPR